MACLGMPRSKDTLLRSLNCGVHKQAPATPVRVVGVDDWSWHKGSTYGTIILNLERREVLDVLQDLRGTRSSSNSPEPRTGNFSWCDRRSSSSPILPVSSTASGNRT